MKTVIQILATVLLASSAQAVSALRIPLFIDLDKSTPVAEINSLIVKAGGEALPEFIEISSNEDGYQKLKELDGKIEKALQLLGKDYQYVGRASEYVPGSNNKSGLQTCYMGNAVEVVDIVMSLADAAYSDQMSLFGFKYENQTKYLQDFESQEEMESFLSSESMLWKNWKAGTDELLILASVGDDGTDVSESVIPRCK